MSWQLAIISQVIASSLLTLWARYISLRHKHAFYIIGFCNYLVVAIAGFLIAYIVNQFSIPPLPHGAVWLYLIGVGIFIPLSWLLGYRLISLIGASNGVIAGLTSFIITALFGFIFLHEQISAVFVIGCAFLLFGMYLSFRIKPDVSHKNSASVWLKLGLVFGSAILLAFGLLCEKKALNSIGVWHYSFYGWSMQFAGSAVLIIALGRTELKKATRGIVRDGLIMGLFTALAGGLFIYALSKGTLSSTMMATSAKATVTVVLAAIFLHERNNLILRVGALTSSLVGLYILLR